MNVSNGAAKALLGAPRTGNYRPNRVMTSAAPTFAGWGFFNLAFVDQMRKDPQVKLCLGYRKAPLAQAEFVVTAKSGPMEQAFVEVTYKRFWKKSLPLALRSYDFGYVGCETLYKPRGDFILFDRLKYLHPRDVIPFTLKSQLAYVQVNATSGSTGGKVDLRAGTSELPGKGFWLTHDGDANPWFGQSVMEPIWVPWRMKQMPQGQLETIFKWAYKYSISPLEVRYPTGERYQTEDNPDGVTAEELAGTMAENLKTGGIALVPSEPYPPDLGGKEKWTIKWAEIEGNPEALTSYGDWLDTQMQRGLEVPDEIVTHDGATGGYSRSRVAVGAFYAGAEASLNHIMEAFDEQVVRPLVRLNFGQDTYTVEAKPLLPPDQQPGMPAPGQPGQPAPLALPAPTPQGGGGPGLVTQTGPRGGHKLVNPATGATRYGNLSLGMPESDLYRRIYEATRRRIRRAYGR